MFAAIAHVGHAQRLGPLPADRPVRDRPVVRSSSDLFDLARRGPGRASRSRSSGCRPRSCPEVLEPGTVVGAGHRRGRGRNGPARPARRSSSAAPTPSSAWSASASSRPDRLTLLGGSFWQLTVVTDAPLIDPDARLRTLCHAVPGPVDDRRHRVLLRHRACAGSAMRSASPRGARPRVAASIRMWSWRKRPRPRARRLGWPPRDLLERDGRQALGPGVAVVPRVRRRRPGADRPRRCIRALEEQAAYATRGHLAIIEELTGRPTTRSCSPAVQPRAALAADRGRRPGRGGAGARRQGIDGPRRRHLRGGRRRALRTVAEVVERVVRFERTVEPDPRRSRLRRAVTGAGARSTRRSSV